MTLGSKALEPTGKETKKDRLKVTKTTEEVKASQRQWAEKKKIREKKDKEVEDQMEKDRVEAEKNDNMQD